MSSAASKKKWTVKPGSGEALVVEADRAELDEAGVRVKFYDAENNVVASFTGFTYFLPVADSK